MKGLVLFFALVMPAFALQINGDAENGSSLTGTCIACHGPDSLAEYPSLDGQHASYLYKQMIRIRGKERLVPLMTGQLVDFSDQQLKNIALYYSEKPARKGVTDKDLVAHGRALYKAGDRKRGIPSCTACHGVSGNGLAGADFPRLAGQKPEYIIVSLNKYRDMEVSLENDLNAKMMIQLSRNLHDDDIKAVASYISGLRETTR